MIWVIDNLHYQTNHEFFYTFHYVLHLHFFFQLVELRQESLAPFISHSFQNALVKSVGCLRKKTTFYVTRMVQQRSCYKFLEGCSKVKLCSSCKMADDSLRVGMSKYRVNLIN